MTVNPPPEQHAESPSSATRAATSHGYSQPMTVLSRGDRIRRSGRRPGWLLLTVLLVLAIAASSALVFTNRVELLKLAVILSLWAAVVGAFVSAIYRRQSDADQAKARDLKMVYDLQLDREISARREYELNVETHLRRELASELRAQSSDEVAALRAELAALRTNLEILFDTDLAHRPAIETDRRFAEWAGEAVPPRPDRVASSRVTVVRHDDDARTAESPIIDVPEEPLVFTPPAPQPVRSEVAETAGDNWYRGSHRLPSDTEETRYIPPITAETPPPAPAPAPVPPWPPVSPPPPPPPAEAEWPAAPSAEWTPAPPPPTPTTPPPMFTPQNGRAAGGAQESERRGRHSSPSELAAMQPAAEEPPPPPTTVAPVPRHRGADEEAATGGQSVADLLARLQHNGSSEGGRRRRRED
jgi:hypothetical protein